MECVDTELTLLTLSAPPPARDFFLSRANLALRREGGWGQQSVTEETGFYKAVIGEEEDLVFILPHIWPRQFRGESESAVV